MVRSPGVKVRTEPPHRELGTGPREPSAARCAVLSSFLRRASSGCWGLSRGAEAPAPWLRAACSGVSPGASPVAHTSPARPAPLHGSKVLGEESTEVGGSAGLSD